MSYLPLSFWEYFQGTKVLTLRQNGWQISWTLRLASMNTTMKGVRDIAMLAPKSGFSYYISRKRKLLIYLHRECFKPVYCV